TAFVDVASREYGIRGRPTNISRIAVMTGLTRKEVRRLRDKISSGSIAVVVKSTPLAQVLHGWFAEDEFLDSVGRPAALPFAGDAGSFSSLVKKFGGDIPPGAMRTELKRVCAIEEDSEGKLRAIRRSIHPKLRHENLVLALMHGAYPMLSNIAHNSSPNIKDNTWPQLTAFTPDVRSADLVRLRRISLDRLAGVAESFDDLFMAYEKLHETNDSSSEKTTVAIGLYYFEEQDREIANSW
ncbi:MAG: hypothetical protein IIA10_08915, partial [Proteobacteria bacterium]|nr:hypothetical protein [Pseudomonadota bacterium]